jgi:hypothetical protein
MNIKQLFCKHIWEDIIANELRVEFKWVYLDYYTIYHHKGINQICLNCGKTRWIERVVKEELAKIKFT